MRFDCLPAFREMPVPDPGVAGGVEAAEREVREALASDPSTASLSQAALRVQLGGFSNLAWTASVGGNQYVIRLSPPDPDRLGVNRESERELLNVVALAGLAPAMLRCDPHWRLLVTHRVGSKPWRREQAFAPRNIARLAQALRALHTLPLSPGIGVVDFATQARHLEVRATAGSAAAGELRATAGRLFERLRSDSVTPTLCHNDLHHLNLIDEGERLWLVDWEYGGIGDPVYDLASFLCQHEAGDLERDRLLAEYDGGAAVDAGRLAAACWTFDYVQWLWYRTWPAAAGEGYARRAAALEQRLERVPG
jgi:aminoglycoside phosphotransferase (APT) family kinase protein